MKSKYLGSAAALIAMLITSQASATTATMLTGNMTADNAFFAYLSTNNNVLGTQIGSGNAWWASYSVAPTPLAPGGVYYLQIEAINYGGPGAILGDFSIGGKQLLTDTTNWSASYNNSNSDPNAQQPWVKPTGGVVSDGLNGGNNIWGNIIGGPISGISSNAQWIDASENGLSSCQNCTVDFSAKIVVSVPEVSTWAMMLIGFAGLGFAGYRSSKKDETAPFAA